MSRHAGLPISEAAFRQAGPHAPEWLAGQLRTACYLGRLRPGDRLPSVRALARQLRVSPTTALELYHELEAEGLVEGRERSGMFLRGSGAPPAGRHAHLFKAIAATAKRLELQGVPVDEFASLLLSYTGRRLRPGVRFGFLGCQEALDLVRRQLARHLKFELPLVAIPPALPPAQIRYMLARDPAIQGLAVTLLSSRLGGDLAGALDLPVVMLCLTPGAAGFFESSAPLRLVIVRDRDCAEALRRTVCSLRLQAEAPDACAATLAADACRTCSRCDDQLLAGVAVASLDETEAAARALGETDTVYAPATSFEAVEARYGRTHRVLPLSLEIAARSIDDLLFQYLFAEACRGRRVEETGSRAAPQPPGRHAVAG
jgi:DNA-binding transcriptional regulator YhcF (GntR family)